MRASLGSGGLLSCRPSFWGCRELGKLGCLFVHEGLGRAEEICLREPWNGTQDFAGLRGSLARRTAARAMRGAESQTPSHDMS